MALSEIFAEKERVDPRGVAAHDHILVVVGKNLRLDEVARAQEIGDGAGLAHGAERAFAKSFAVLAICTLQFLAAKRRDLPPHRIIRNASRHRPARSRTELRIPTS